MPSHFCPIRIPFPYQIHAEGRGVYLFTASHCLRQVLSVWIDKCDPVLWSISRFLYDNKQDESLVKALDTVEHSNQKHWFG